MKMFSRYKDLQLFDDKSCLSARVYNLVCKRGISSEVIGKKFLEENGCISINYLSKTLPEYKEDSYEYFEDCSSALGPLFFASSEYLSALSEDEFNSQFGHFLQWTSLPQTLKRCFMLLKEEDTIKQGLALLLIMPVFERSLGDVFLIKGQQCPSMIKDLLVTEELKDILGPTVIQLLRVLIGPPISLNLRNISWHGFPSGEISSRYGIFTLHLIATLGKICDDQLKCCNIPHREFTVFPQVERWNGVFPDMSQCDTDVMCQLFRESTFVMTRMEPYWKYAAECFKYKRYADCIVLLLPQLEHGLRRTFAVANSCPQRVLTAENTVFFTTFDEILASTLQDQGENQLRYHIGDSYISLLLDLLMYPEGPRLRDRISHGETDYNRERSDSDNTVQWQIISNHLISMCVAFCMLYVSDDSDLFKEDILNKVVDIAKTYQSMFHPVALLISEIKFCVQSLCEWMHIERPSQNEMATAVEWHELFKKDGELQTSDVYKAGLFYIEKCENLHPEDTMCLLCPFQCTEREFMKLCDININTLYRSKVTLVGKSGVNQEEEIIGLLRRIVAESIQASEQIKKSCKLKYEQWKAKNLRSRQRETYKRMLDIIPVLSCGLRLALLIGICHVYALDSKDTLQSSKYVKFLKFVLQYCENLYIYTSTEKNRWEEAEKFTKSLYTKCLSIG